MKTKLFFLKGISIVCLSIFLSLFNCGSDVDVQTVEMPPPLTDVLTFEFSFGDEKTITKDEFLLAGPLYGPYVNNDNDIFVPDETRIKVYDRTGKPKMIIGGPGQGPGEFSWISGITFNDLGLMTVIGRNDYHIFSPEYKFIKRLRYLYSDWYNPVIKESGYFMDGVTYVYSLDYDRRIIVPRGRKLYTETPGARFHTIIFETPDSVNVITEFTMAEYIEVDRFLTYPAELGWIMFDMLPGNRLVYTYFIANEPDNIQDSQYILHVIDLDSGKKTEISHTYTPHPITKAPTQTYEDKLENPDTSEEDKRSCRKMISKIKDRFKDIPYYIPLRRIKTDNNYIFAFTFFTGDSTEILADIFDGDTGNYLRSAFFTFIPEIIKNGYAYKYNDWRENNEFPLVEKYKIDPAVYGK